jgi:hypothetical protein
LAARNCAVHPLSVDEAMNTIQRRVALATADIIVLVPESSVLDVDDALACTARFVSGVMLEGDAFAAAVHELPRYCTMPAGRRWNRIPLFIFLQHRTDNVTRAWSDYLTICTGSVDYLYDTLVNAVTSYRRRLLSEFSNLGYLVFEEHGRFRVGPAMVPREDGEGELYSASGDTRPHSPYFTVDRDIAGLQYEVEAFEALISREDVSEREIQRSFEDNPHFLTLNQFVPIAHPQFPRKGRGPLIPDFVLKPIVAQQRDSRWEVLDLEHPHVRLTAGPADRPRLSHHVYMALAQLRDYRNYFQ